MLGCGLLAGSCWVCWRMRSSSPSEFRLILSLSPSQLSFLSVLLSSFRSLILVLTPFPAFSRSKGSS